MCNVIKFKSDESIGFKIIFFFAADIFQNTRRVVGVL